MTMPTDSEVVYSEKLSSDTTEALFVALTLIFFLLLLWRSSAAGLDLLAGVFLGLSALFLFYVVNYRTLQIRLTTNALTLTFGVFVWKVPLENVADCRLDEMPLVMRFGGAGIHFMFIRRRYRASFNFLEYPRVVLALKRPVGPVRDISFTTRRPDEVIQCVNQAISTGSAAGP
jgi:hypothetical protein